MNTTVSQCTSSLGSEIDRFLSYPYNSDVIKRELTVSGKRALLYYIDGLVKEQILENILCSLEILPDGIPPDKILYSHLPIDE